MAWKFFNIAKANTEIERLEGEVSALKTQLEQVAALPADVQKHAEGLQAQVTKLSEDLQAQSANVIDLLAAKAKLEADAAKHAEVLAAKSAEVDKIAAAKALEITTKQGQPPLDLGATPVNPAKVEAPKQDIHGRDLLIVTLEARRK